MNRTHAQCSSAIQVRPWLKSVCFLAACLIVSFLLCVASFAQSASLQKRSITLEPPTGLELQEHLLDSRGEALPQAPDNFRRVGEAKAGEPGTPHTLTFRFSENLRLRRFKLSPDFKIEKGGSCVEGGNYVANSTCTLLVRFTPKGAGQRLGHLAITSSTAAGESTYAFGIGGYGYAPVISFIPSIITTLPGSYPSNVGLLSGAQNLWVDGSDTLWVSDTGNNVVRNYDSSGTFNTLASGFSAPLGITVDTFGEAYFSRPAANTIHEIYDYGPVVQINGTGTSACPASTPCTFSAEAVGNPGMLSMDPYNHMFFVDNHMGAAMGIMQPEPAKLVFLYDPFPYQTNPSSPIVADSSDNIYSFWSNGGECEIVQASLYNAENSNVSFTKIAGGHTCGFNGDGGLAGNAEIGATMGQMAFDIASNLYFSDTANQRVRRIDYTTGIIHTIAGNGTAGYTGDNNKATSATLSTPTGVAVDSTGSVYIISSAANNQVIRKVGPQGFVTFGNQAKGKASTAQSLTVSNTGNSTMVLTNFNITGTNAADFKIDSNSTTCILTTGSMLAAGQTCYIGLIFTPAAVGARKATLTLLNNTVSGTNTVSLSGTGTLPTPTLAITAPANGATFTSGTAVTFSASVTSTSGAQPTGTVQFKVDGANYGSPVTLSSTGTASTSVTGLTTTTHTLSVTYSGDTNYAAAGPVTVSITVKAAATVKFVSPTASQTMSSNTSFPIKVTVSSKVTPAPTGNVTFTVDGKQLGSPVKVASGAASTTASLASGTHTIHAAYAGDKTHHSASSSESITVK